MRLILTSLILTCVTLFTASAGAAAVDKAAAEKVTAEKRNFEQVISSGKLRVGVFLLTPYVMQGQDGGLIGSEVDIATRIAKDIGVAVDFKLYDWNALIPALQKGEVDIIVSGLSVTPERALKVYFSNPYATSGIGIATNIKLTASFNSLAELNNPQVAIGAIGGTVSEQVAREIFDKAAIKTFTEEKQAEDALVKGLLHAYVRADPEPRFIALRHPREVDVPITKPLLGTSEAFAVRKGDGDFVNFLNAWIVARSADAWLASTHNFWFETLGWQKMSATAPTTSSPQ